MMASWNLLASYARGPRIWDAASLLPQVAELAAAGLIEPVPDSAAYRLTSAGQAELARGDQPVRATRSSPSASSRQDAQSARILEFFEGALADQARKEKEASQEQVLTVTIPLTAAMRTPDDLGLALRQIAAKIQGGTGSGVVRDRNGNFAGEFDITPGTTSGLESGTQ